MTKNEQNRILAWRLKLLREASVMPRNVAQACRHFGLSRQTFYKWKARYKSHGDAGLHHLHERSRLPIATEFSRARPHYRSRPIASIWASTLDSTIVNSSAPTVDQRIVRIAIFRPD